MENQPRGKPGRASSMAGETNRPVPVGEALVATHRPVRPPPQKNEEEMTCLPLAGMRNHGATTAHHCSFECPH
jgi:hypothetical protein